jgi:transposase
VWGTPKYMKNGERTEAFKKLRKNTQLLKKLRKGHRLEYQRRRLRAIELLWKGYSRYEVSRLVGVAYTTLTTWVQIMVTNGVKEGLHTLVAPITHIRKQRLDAEKKKELFRMMTEETPQDHGVDRFIWTAEVLVEVINKKWKVSLHDSRIYEILNELGLSHQRAHRDYANADPVAQKAFVAQVKKKSQNWLLASV